MNPDQLEVAPGVEHEQLEGVVWEIRTDEDLRIGLEKAFEYRGDITITKKDGAKVEGYLFDRRPDSVRLIPKDRVEKISISFHEIAGLAFTGRDTAAGKSWEAWVKKHKPPGS